MKKTNILKLLSSLLIVLLTSLTFTACSDDDDDKGGSSNSLNGRWISNDETYQFIFNKDLTFYYSEVDDDDDCYYCKGRYSVSGNTIKITAINYNKDSELGVGMKFQFSLSGNNLTLSIFGDRIKFVRDFYGDGDEDDWDIW